MIGVAVDRFPCAPKPRPHPRSPRNSIFKEMIGEMAIAFVTALLTRGRDCFVRFCFLSRCLRARWAPSAPTPWFRVPKCRVRSAAAPVRETVKR